MSRSFNKTQYRINPTNNSVIKFSKISQKIKNQQPKKKIIPTTSTHPLIAGEVTTRTLETNRILKTT